jgi:hypothetical protein
MTDWSNWPMVDGKNQQSVMTDHIYKFRLKMASALSVILCAAALSFAQAQDQVLREYVAQLGSDDSQVRENALDHLMDLKSKDLPALRSAAISQAPLTPGQIAGIRQVVTEVFLAGESYRVDPDSLGGFVGLHWDTGNAESTDGVLVGERLPGFAAYRSLRSGDIIRGFADWPALKVINSSDVTRIVRSLPPGETVRLEVQRYGRLIVVPIVLDFIPADAPTDPGIVPATIEAWLRHWLADRSAKAEDFWNREFAVIDPSTTALRSAPARAEFAQTSSTSLQP